MKPFLYSVAEDLYNYTDGHLENVTIIFPNKRASLFFNQYLAQLNGNKPMWLPEYTTITDIFSSTSQLTPADPILLICMLHKAFVKLTNTDETLDKFWSWGEIILQDFNDIDNNMIPTDMLFANIEELSAMTDFTFLTKEQVETIKTFFSNFSPNKSTKLKEKFNDMWGLLHPLYHEFRSMLRTKGYAYPGMLKRDVAERLNITGSPSEGFNSQTYAIVGFNVLNKTEQVLFKYLKIHHNTLFYWDYDNAYINKQDNTSEAGMFIKDNIFRFGDKFQDNKHIHDSFHEPKNISIISATTENAQARYVDQWLNETLSSSTSPLNRTAIVLCNENLLHPVIHSIPQNILINGAENECKVNITMGHPLRETTAASYLIMLLNLQIRGKARTRDTWHYNHVVSILNHPYTRRITGGESYVQCKEIQKKSNSYPTTENIVGGDEMLSHIFTHHNDIGEMLTYLSHIFNEIGKSYKTSEGNEFEQILGMESIFIIHEIINRLTTLYETGTLQISKYTLARLFIQIVATRTIPFHGEPANGIQVMGMLETRNLDFENVIIMSANEGNLPPKSSSASLIPYTLRQAYEMTTIEKQTSLYAYNFYHLCQRAKNITILYNTSCDGMTQGEMSRFVMQLQIEAPQLMSPHTQISLKTIMTQPAPMITHAIKATKTDYTTRKLERKYLTSNPEHASLSPSAINSYIDCPLRFYLNRLTPIKIVPFKEVDEDVDSANFGNVIHLTMQTLYTPFIGKKVTSEELLAIARDKDNILRIIDSHLTPIFTTKTKNFRPTGTQLLNRHVLYTYVKRQLETDAKACPMKIIGLEDNTHSLEFTITHDKKVRLGGIIDRLDSTLINDDQCLRIVDYKTSARAQKTKSVDELFNADKQARAYHIMQIFTYALILSEEQGATPTPLPIAPSLIYVKLNNKDTTPDKTVVSVGKEAIVDFKNTELPEAMKENLRQTLSQLFNPNTPFTPTNQNTNCNFCDFKQLCNTINS